MTSTLEIEKLNRGLSSLGGSGLDEEITYLKCIGPQTVKISFEKWETIGPLACKNCTNLQKVWIPKEVKKISADTLEKAPFLGCGEKLQIFTDVENEESIPESWGKFWNYCAEGKTLNVNYNNKTSQYDSYKVISA